jgi:AcrR family transcriptional regulator
MTAANSGRKKPGRPTGSSNTRERILDCARDLFARNGINNTSIRAVAAAAGVDSALVHHYFGNKEKLFAAAVHIPIDPMDVIGPLRDVPIEQLGHRLPSILLSLWDSEMGAGFIATLRSILAGSEVNLFRTFIQDVIAVEVGSRVDDPLGSGIMDLEPFASLPAQQIADTIAPNLQRYLTGDLPGLPAR